VEASALFPKSMRADDRAKAIEYRLIAALISLAAPFAFQLLGLNRAEVFGAITRAMGGGSTGSTGDCPYPCV